MAQIVHDTDRSYTLSAGDAVREVELEGGACGKVEFFGEGDAPLDAELPLPYADQSVRGLSLDDLIDPNDPLGKGKGSKGKVKAPKKKIKGGDLAPSGSPLRSWLTAQRRPAARSIRGSTSAPMYRAIPEGGAPAHARGHVLRPIA